MLFHAMLRTQERWQPANEPIHALLRLSNVRQEVVVAESFVPAQVVDALHDERHYVRITDFICRKEIGDRIADIAIGVQQSMPNVIKWQQHCRSQFYEVVPKYHYLL